MFVSHRTINIELEKNAFLTGHWLRYSTSPNLVSLSSESLQAIKVEFLLLLTTITGHFYFFSSPHASFHTPSPIITPNNAKFLMACLSQYDTRLAVNIDND